MPRPAVSPPVTADQYRLGMRAIPGAVAVITTVHDGQRNGLTATAVSSVSAEPPQLLVCVNRQASAHPLIADGGRFVVNFLTTEHQDIANRFGQSKFGEKERFEAGDWLLLASGLPALADALAIFDCRLVHHAVLGTHSVFVGEVTDVRINAGSPLLYHSGQYRRLQLD